MAKEKAKAKLRALSVTEIRRRLPALPGWSHARGALRRQFKLDSFQKALDFVVLVGGMAEAADHHPDIDIRYRVVRLALSTHDVGGISDRDFSLATAINQKSVA